MSIRFENSTAALNIYEDLHDNQTAERCGDQGSTCSVGSRSGGRRMPNDNQKDSILGKRQSVLFWFLTGISVVALVLAVAALYKCGSIRDMEFAKEQIKAESEYHGQSSHEVGKTNSTQNSTVKDELKRELGEMVLEVQKRNEWIRGPQREINSSKSVYYGRSNEEVDVKVANSTKNLTEIEELKIKIEEILKGTEAMNSRLNQLTTKVSKHSNNMTIAQMELNNFDSSINQRLSAIEDNFVSSTDIFRLRIEIRQALASFYILNGWSKTGNLLYKCNTDRATYDSASSNCRNRGARLAAKVLRQRDSVRQINQMNCNGWVGLNDKEREGVWEWSDGRQTNTEITSWKPGQPDNWGNEDCAVIYTRSSSRITLNDVSCTANHQYICEIDISTAFL